jgi:glycosyltransferase involved in cell wall biosynthesis
MKITAVVLTKNEEKNIRRCLKSVDFCEEVIVIDDYSTDKTLEKIQNPKSQIPNKPKIQIFKRKLNGDFAEQRNFGMSKASNDWILFLDADEEISLDLKKEIISQLSVARNEIEAFYIKRRDFFWEKELKYGEVRHIRLIGLIRLIRKDSGKWQGNVHEVYFTSKASGVLEGFLNHYPHPTLKDFLNKINLYSDLRANELYKKGKKTNVFQILIWPFGKFIYSYFIKLGFLDGPVGFVYSFMMSFHSFLVRTKLYMLYQQHHK